MPSTISKQKKKDPFKEHTNKSKLSDKVKKKTDRTRKDAPANDARINPPKNKTLKELEADLAAKHKKQKKAQEDSLNKTKIQPGEKTGKEKKAEQARKDAAARKKAAEEAAKRNEKKTPPANGTKKTPPANGKKKPPTNGKKPPANGKKPSTNGKKSLPNSDVNPNKKELKKNTEPKKKKSTARSRMREKNVARHGEKTVKHLEDKNKDFQKMKKKKMTKAEFIKKYPKSITAQKAAGLRR